jgi:hypothetical protein
MKSPLAQQDFINAAATIGCKVAAVKAVTKVEAPHGGFDDKDRPTILFEPFIFGDMTNQAFDGRRAIINGHPYPLSCNRRKMPWSVKNADYGPSSIQYDKLDEAAKLNRTSALQSCSWGMFQILGSNYLTCGFDDIQDFVNAMYAGTKQQLDAFVGFIMHNRLDKFLKAEDWNGFAYHYNGPKQDKGTADIHDDYSYFILQAFNYYTANPDA